MPRNYFSQGAASEIIGAGNDAFDRQTALYDDVNARYTATRAGRRMAQGDRMGASREFANAGLLDEARVLEGDQVAADTRMRADQDRTKAAEQAAAAKRAETAAAVFSRLQTIQPGQRSATLRRAAPLFQAVGIDPSPFLSMPEEAFSDEELAMAVGQVKRDLEFVKGSGGGWQALDKGTASVVASGMAPQPAEIKQFDPDKNVVEIPATPGTNSAPGGIAAPLRDLEAMGVRVTSDVRTTERNRQVGGVPNSRHMSGEALDLTPPQGMTMAQLAQETKRRFPQARVINEGDHVHVEWGAQRANPFPNAPRVLQQAAPKERDAPSGYEWSGGRLRPIPGGPADPAVKANTAPSRKDFASLRKEFNGLDEVKNFKDVSAAYRQVRALGGRPNPTPADDMALTFSFMKMLDPGSVVRESEYALVAQSAGLPDQVVMGIDALTKGRGLTPQIRARIIDSAAKLLLERRAAYDSVAGTYREIATDLGANPDQLAEDPSRWRTRIKQPKAGPVQGGSGKRPDGVTAAEWSAMTPQERALFK